MFRSSKVFIAILLVNAISCSDEGGKKSKDKEIDSPTIEAKDDPCSRTLLMQDDSKCEDTQQVNDGDSDSETSDANSNNASTSDPALRPTELTACHDKQQVFDQLGRECHEALLATSWCSRDQIVEIFEDMDQNFAKKLTQQEEDGFEIDQCGVLDGQEVVYLAKISKNSSGKTVVEARWYPRTHSSFGFKK